MLKVRKKLMKRNHYRQLQEGDILFSELKDKYNNGAILLDVRSPQEYSEEHLSGAILIPDYEFNIRKNELEKYINNTIIVYCKSGSRSRKIYQILKKMGYMNVYNLYGGLDNL